MSMNDILQIETMAYAGSSPWGEIGTQVSNDLSPQQMMQKAGLDWSVSKIPTYARGGRGRSPDRNGSTLFVSTDNKILTQVGGKWNPVQNENCLLSSSTSTV